MMEEQLEQPVKVLKKRKRGRLPKGADPNDYEPPRRQNTRTPDKTVLFTVRCPMCAMEHGLRVRKSKDRKQSLYGTCFNSKCKCLIFSEQAVLQYVFRNRYFVKLDKIEKRDYDDYMRIALELTVQQSKEKEGKG